MESWALVIGIDRYELPGASLKGAVRDALGMREWLLDPGGGGLPEKNVTLLLSPREEGGPPGVEAKEATQGNILDAIAELIQRSGGAGERLYFFFAGHGVSTFVDASEENALVASDFTSTRTQNSVALRTLWEYFETWQFKDQFFFVDACRNIPVDFDFRVGEWTQPRRRDPGVPPVQQFILYATSPGLRATETGPPGDERGHFTDALLAGLHGAGSAKAWSRADACYQVRWDRLVRYVKKEIEERKVAAGGPGAENIFQIPQETPKRGVAGQDPDPVLSRFPASSFPPERLAINLRPEDVYSVAEVIISRDWGEPYKRETNIPRLPVEFELDPNVYLIRGIAPDYEEAYYAEPLELYTGCTIDVDFRPLAPGQPEAKSGLDTGDGAKASAPTTAGDGREQATLVVTASDPLAPVELTDAAGRALAAGVGTATIDDASPGVYRARLRTGENEVVEKLVEVAPGAEREVVLTAPEAPATGAVNTFAAALGGERARKGRARAAGGERRVPAAGLSTLLGLASAKALAHDAALRDAGFRAADEAFGAKAECGLYVLLGTDGNDPRRARRRLEGVGLRVWRLGEPVPAGGERAHSPEGVPYAAEFARALAAGAYWIALERPRSSPVVVALALLSQRVTTVTVELDRRDVRISQYAPLSAGNGSGEPETVRRLELMERLLVGGELSGAFALARDVLEAPEIVDPLATALAGYTALRAGRLADADPAIERLASEYAELSDAHLLLGEREAAAGRRDSARDAFARAVEAGAPVFAEGLTRLLEGLRAYEIEHENTRLVRHLFEHHVSGSMWSAWVADGLREGKLVIP